MAVPAAERTAAHATDTTCTVNPAQGSVWASGDSDKLLAGTDASRRGYSLMGAAQDMGAWAYYNHNYFGQGIDVAVIDTGTAPVQGLTNGNVIHGPDFSFDGQSKLAHTDTNGHGTMMASLIGGRDSATSTVNPGAWSEFNGIAPRSRVVSVKTGESQGAIDVTQMIAAIDWVVAHAHDNGLNIRVLNISYGVPAIDAPSKDALSYAVDQAWKKAKIVVVAAAGNSGAARQNSGTDWTTSGTGVQSPAYNANVLAVASYDTGGTPKLNRNGAATGSTYASDDIASSYSSSSSNLFKRDPDVAAPGDHVTGLHDVGSFMDDQMQRDCLFPDPDVTNPEPWTTPIFGPNNRFARGSGTSEAAALTSGAVALMLSKDPTLLPDQVKNLLMTTAAPLGTTGQSGRGEINLAAVYAAAKPAYAQKNAAVAAGGTMDDARGGSTWLGTTWHQYVTAWKELVPGVCTNYFESQWARTDDPNAYNTAITSCVYIDLADAHDSSGKFLYSRDMFGNAINLKQLQTDEANATAWKTPSGKSYQVWSGDAAFTIGTGFVDDPNKDPATLKPILGKVWAQGTSWPGDWQRPTSHALSNDTTHSWSTSTQRWAYSGLTSFSLRAMAWLRHSLTDQDWTSHSLRDNAWR